MILSQRDSHAVDLVVNTFERTYRRALAPGAITEIREANAYPFARCTVLINNVVDPADASDRAQQLLDAGEIDEFQFVTDHVDHALRAVGLRRGELEPMLHYCDGPLVAATLPGSPWFLYWDPEARLAQAVNWISPALQLMCDDERLMIANPSWEPARDDGRRPGVEREAIETRGGFCIGHGFSDQVFLARRATMAAPIYRQRCIVSIVYPTAHRAQIFEARVGAYMRHHGRLRATSLEATYLTDTSAGGSSYAPHGALETARYWRNALALKLFGASPWRPACLRHTAL